MQYVEVIKEVFGKCLNSMGNLHRSGLELNAEKTEILALNGGRCSTDVIKYCEQRLNIKTVNEVKICGLWYCNENRI
jgi:hypothetical protein